MKPEKPAIRFAAHEKLGHDKIGTLGWIALTGAIIAWDVKAKETLSGAIDRGLEHDYLKYVIPPVIGTVALHLLNVFPDKYDPVLISAELVKKAYGKLTSE